MFRKKREGPDKNTIYFWGKLEGNYFLSNFYEKAFEAEGIVFKTAEHYYQWLKTFHLTITDRMKIDEYRKAIIDSPKPMQAKRLGHNVPLKLKEWDYICIKEMEKVIEAKFKDKKMEEKLLKTGDKYLTEISDDARWGIGNKFDGENHLGIILMNLQKDMKVLNN